MECWTLSVSSCCTINLSNYNERAAMSVVSPQENIVRVFTTKGEPVSLRIEADVPVTVQLEIENNCSCGGSARRTGAYTDTDFGTR